VHTLEQLWRTRERRVSTLIVIDEAHNLCPAHPSSPLLAHTTDTILRIANEGHKFGLRLALITQPPARIELGVLAQRENLILLRVNGRGDLVDIQTALSHIPPGLISGAADYPQGSALVAGWFTPRPLLVQFGGRLTAAGGSDVVVAKPRS
jgi:uncharacterized protein